MWKTYKKHKGVMKKLNLSKLLFESKNPENKEIKIPKGTKNGICVMCGLKMENGLSMKELVSENFTGWGRLFTGDGICPSCAFIFQKEFRRNCWVVSKELCFLERAEVSEILFNPPEPPFFVYIRKAGMTGGRKQGWLACLHKVAWNKDHYHFAHEEFDIPIWFERKQAEKYWELIVNAIKLGISKKALRGDMNVYNCKKAYRAGKLKLINEIRKNKGNPLWEVLIDVFAIPKRGK